MSTKLYAKALWGVCQCGHYEWQHDDTMPLKKGKSAIAIRAMGHGECLAPECECKQYTWVKSVNPFFG